MDHIDYTEVRFQFIGVRKHFFKDKSYYISVFDDSFVMGEKKNSTKPKYVYKLDFSTKIQWEVKKAKNSMRLCAFWFPYNGQPKAMHADHESLLKFKKLIQCKALFTKVSEIYLPQSQLGKGSSSKVFKAINQLDLQVYAVKAIEKSYLRQTEENKGMTAFYSEIQIMKALQDPKDFLQLHEIYEGDQTYYLILSYLDGNTLGDELEKAKNTTERKLTPNQIKTVMGRLFNILNQLHANYIIHRDLKPDNLMFAHKNDFNSLILVDFGLSTFENVETYLFPKCGTPGYVAPEVLNNKPNQRYSSKVDIFQRWILFQGQTFDDILKANKRCSPDLDLPIDGQYINESSLNLLKQLLNKNPKIRLTAGQALQHHYFEAETRDQSQTKDLSQMANSHRYKGNLQNLILEEQESRYESQTNNEGQCQQFVQWIEIKRRKSTLVDKSDITSPNRFSGKHNSFHPTSTISSFYNREPLSNNKRTFKQCTFQQNMQ
ncbi:hypothetical protein pb186bvf_016516 [Paramecium bursaria]